MGTSPSERTRAPVNATASLTEQRRLDDEFNRCLPFFTRIVVDLIVETGAPLSVAARNVADHYRGAIAAETAMTQAQRDLFLAVIGELEALIGHLGQKLTPDTIRRYVEASGADGVTQTIQRFLLKARRADLPDAAQ